MKRYFLNLFVLLLLLYVPLSAQTFKWTELKPTNSPSPRAVFSMAQIDDRKVLLFGGSDSKNHLNDTWILDLNNFQWKQINTKHTPNGRFKHGLATLTKGKVLLFGGFIIQDGWEKETNDTWIFDIDKMDWEEIVPKDTAFARESFAISQLSDKKVLIFGGNVLYPGETESSYGDDEWIFDLDKNSWIQVPYFFPLPASREASQMAYLEEGKTLLYGGWHFKDLNDNQLFDERLNKFIKINLTDTCIPISQSSMANLEDGKIVLFGGNHDSWARYQGTWLFNLSDSSWQQLTTDQSPPGRAAHGISKIEKNKILLFGGTNSELNKLYNDTWLLEYIPNEIIDFKEIDYNFKVISQYNNNHIMLKYFSKKLGKCKIDVFNLLGHRLCSELISLLNGNNDIELEFNHFESGIYIVVLTIDGSSYTDKLIILK